MTREEFVLNGIQDTVGTIRAFDLKAQIFLAILLIPFTNYQSWVEKADSFCLVHSVEEFEFLPSLWCVLLFVMLGYTFWCILCLLRIIYPQKTDISSISNAPKGVFYTSNLLEKSSVAFSEIQAEYPKEGQCLEELQFEHFKLKRLRLNKEINFQKFKNLFWWWALLLFILTILTFIV